MPHTLATLNRLDQAAFAAALGSIFEATPVVAEIAWQQRPFATVDALHCAMMAVVQSWPRDRQVAFLQAHPELGQRGMMAAASVAEQQSRGLNQLSTLEAERLQHLNRAYREKFGFPFIVAVKNYSRDQIFAALETRLQSDGETEHRRAIAEIAAITRFRLEAAID
jgi:2-oxo-4-hydroxy-4-carboxy-5-ureidoimidazoline decarboxylase